MRMRNTTSPIFARDEVAAFADLLSVSQITSTVYHVAVNSIASDGLFELGFSASHNVTDVKGLGLKPVTPLQVTAGSRLRQ